MTPREEQIRFHEAFARAITQWAHVEMDLFQVFQMLVQTRNPRIASIIFHSALNFNLKVSMTDFIAKTILHGSNLES